MKHKKYRYNPLYKNFLNLKVNPLNNNKFIKLKLQPIIREKKRIQNWIFVNNSKKKKWEEFVKIQIRSKSRFNRFKPYTLYLYKTSKFASQGNAFKKRFKQNLLAKTTFNYLYGGFSKKYLKKQMSEIYTSKKLKNYMSICTEYFESRLDSVIYKAKFCKSIKNARQIISHKHVKVNGVTERNKNYIVKKGDSVTFKQKPLKLIQTNLQEQHKTNIDSIIWPLPPTYLNINYKTFEIIMGDITNFNFSNSFTFKPDIYSIIKNNYQN